jgi:hypothetical protein
MKIKFFLAADQEADSMPINCAGIDCKMTVELLNKLASVQ